MQRLDPVFASLASAQAPRSYGQANGGRQRRVRLLHCGPAGAGHFVKMAQRHRSTDLMAAYAEGFNILRQANIGNAEQAGGDAEMPASRRPIAT